LIFQHEKKQEENEKALDQESGWCICAFSAVNILTISDSQTNWQR